MFTCEYHTYMYVRMYTVMYINKSWSKFSWCGDMEHHYNYMEPY